MVYERPGVYVNEVLRPPSEVTVAEGTSSGMIIGETDRGPLEPTRVRSWTQFRRMFGGFESNTDMAYAAYQFFLNNGSELYVGRLSDGPVVAERDFEDRATTPEDTLRIQAKSAGEWGNRLNISITDGVEDGRFNIVVYEDGTALPDVVEQWTDLSMDENDDRYVERIVNHPVNYSNYIKVEDLSSPTEAPDNAPALEENVSLAGGDDGLEITNSAYDDWFSLDGNALLDQIEVPFNLNLPGVSDSAVINDAISYAESRGDIFLVIDPEEGAGVDSAVTTAGNYTESSYYGVYYPRIWIGDPARSDASAVKLVPPGGAVLGRFADTDDRVGPWKPAAGLGTEVRGGFQLERKLTDPDLAKLNVNHVNAIRHITGNGLRIMGARTGKKRQADKYVSVRRALIYIKDNLKRNTNFALFKPNNEDLWAEIRSAVDGFLNTMYQEGGLRGASASEAYYVKCDAELNTQDVIDQGQVRVEVGVALLQPAEFVVITVGQWYGGISSATESTE